VGIVAESARPRGSANDAPAPPKDSGQMPGRSAIATGTTAACERRFRPARGKALWAGV